MNHAKTPWTHDGRMIYDADGVVVAQAYATEEARGIENAAAIVSALNAHDDLVAALRSIACQSADDERIEFFDFMRDAARTARTALAKFLLDAPSL